MFHRLIKQIAKLENVTEQLKADNPMEWVTRMNNIRSRVMEIVNHDIIFNQPKNGGREIFSLPSIYFANVIDFHIALRYTICIGVRCIALELMGGV